MVGRALSETAKRAKQRRAEGHKMAKALDAYQQEQAKPHGVTKKGLRKIAFEHGVDPSTLGHHAQGGISMSAFNAKKQKLSPAEE